MVARFNAAHFDTVTNEMRRHYQEDGIIALEGMLEASACDQLKERMLKLVADAHTSQGSTDGTNGTVGADGSDSASGITEGSLTVFSTLTTAHANEDYFLSSGHEIRFFYEEDALSRGADWMRTQPVERLLNKVGHAMHDCDPVFDAFSRQERFRTLTRGLGVADPLLLQSMYIFKQPHIGGEVVCHQDATFLWTEPQSVIGLWVALEDATTDNGCLWGIPGGHRAPDGTPLLAPKKHFRRKDIANPAAGTEMLTLDDTPFDEEKAVPLEVKKGSVLAFNGLFPHMSRANTSPSSRHAYTLHIIDGKANYPKDNWLVRPATMPLRGF